MLTASAALLLCSCWLLAADAAPATHEMELRMPEVSPKHEDTYLCTAVPLHETRYIKEFIPKHESGHAHHIILAGCAQPGSKEKVWNCGEMQSETTTGEQAAPQCAGQTRMLYAYAMDAPALTLPDGVTFGVGPEFDLPYLVVQVHYKKVAAFRKDSNLKDKSGVQLVYQLQPSPKLGGIHLSVTDGVVPARSVSVMETACSYEGSAHLHPFAFRTHTHSHGRVVSGFRVRNSDWKLIGSANPQLPQMFYKVNNTLTVRPGDTVAARCVMENNGDTDVAIGATQKDEMCNFYMMYWIRAADVGKDAGKDGNRMCFSSFNSGSASFWDEAPESAAEISATIPGSGRVFAEFTRQMNDEWDEWNRELDASEARMSNPIFDRDVFDF